MSEVNLENTGPTPPAGRSRSRRRRIWIGLAAVAILIVYAYGFEVTDVGLEEIKSETRQEQLVRVLRDLARPEILTYERMATNTDLPFYMPCPVDEVTSPEVGVDARQVSVEPSCVDPGGQITVTGTNFAPNARGTLYLVPPSGDLELRLDAFLTDEEGSFFLTVDTRERSSDEPQTIRAVTREQIGSVFNRVDVPTGEFDDVTGEEIVVRSPRISEAAISTWDRIIETVFLALLATTLGTLIGVPLSFIAARNLMRDIKTTVAKLSLQIIALPLGAVAGVLLAAWARAISESLESSGFVQILGLLILSAACVAAVRWAIPAVDEPDQQLPPLVRSAVLIAAATGAIVVLFLIAAILQDLGSWLAPQLASLSFVGGFVANIGEILATVITLISALFGAGVLVNIAGKLGTQLRARLPVTILRIVNLVLAMAAGALTAVLVARGLGWLYRVTDPAKITWIPILVGAGIGLYLAVRSWRQESVAIGLVIYYISRTIFNAIRSIEPLIMVIVFVVWVGLGAFAGMLALALHTIAALAKLYSEQVESIMAGPIEAVRATGATRTQTIVYAVIPQIVPPYISFTMYRWDINVRMSTIIGFAGGGGIGFLIQQNIRLLDYRAASVNMLAIAIVVASMDYLSSRIRERIV